MSTKKYFKQSDYADLWSKAVQTRDSLATEAKKYLAIINTSPGTSLLDVGVGQGRFIMPCVRTGVKNYVGVDISKETLLNAKANCAPEEYVSAVSLVQGDAEHLPFQEGVFERIICCGTSWYLPNKHSFISEISRVSKSDFAFFGDFMNSSNRSIYLQKIERNAVNSILRIIRGLKLRKPILYGGTILDRLYKGKLYGFDKEWFDSYLTWGVTPFHPVSFSDLITLFELYDMRIDTDIRSKNAPLIYVEASKHSMRAKQQITPLKPSTIKCKPPKNNGDLYELPPDGLSRPPNVINVNSERRRYNTKKIVMQ